MSSHLESVLTHLDNACTILASNASAPCDRVGAGTLPKGSCTRYSPDALCGGCAAYVKTTEARRAVVTLIEHRAFIEADLARRAGMARGSQGKTP